MAVVRKADSLSNVQNKKTIYSDFLTSFFVGKDINDLTIVENEESVKQSIVNILLTNTGEKFYNSSFGSNLNSLLFENNSPQTIAAITDLIISTIENFETRAKINDVIVSPVLDDSAYAVTINFSVINKTEPLTLEFLLDRTR